MKTKINRRVVYVVAAGVCAAVLLSVIGIYIISSAARDKETKKSFSLPYTVAWGALDDKGMSVEVRMTKGHLITEDSPEYAPGGGPDGMVFEENYIGNYEIVTIKNKRVISRIPLEFSDYGNRFSYPCLGESVELEDYNDDGQMEFTWGVGGLTGNNRVYNMYTITADGMISVLMKDIYQSMDGYSKRFEKIPAESDYGSGFYTVIYDNSLSQWRRNRFVWNGKEFTLEESKIIPMEEKTD